MGFVKNFISYLNYLPKSLKAIFGILFISAAIFVPITLAHASTNAPADCEANSMMWGGATQYDYPTTSCDNGTYSKAHFDDKFDNGDGLHPSSILKADYSLTGIDESILMSSKVVDGYVYDDNTVKLADGQLVGTNAWSYGRFKICDNDIKVGDLWKRHPECSFASSKLAAWIYMKDGVFQWAVLKSCGNSVVATPVYFICKSLTASPDNGEAPLKVTFTATVSVKGAKVKTYKFDFGNGDTKNIDSTKTKLSTDYTYKKAGTFTASVRIVTDQGTTAETQDCKTPITVKSAPPVAVINCVSLAADTTIGEAPLKVNFTATASVKNDTIDRYTFDFGDGQNQTVQTSETTAMAEHTYDQAGDFTANVVVFDTEGNHDGGVAPCALPITVTPIPPTAGCIIVEKETFDVNGNPFTPVPQFSFTLDGERTAKNTDDGIAKFTEVSAGEHQVTEKLPNDNWKQLSVTPTDGKVTVEDAKCSVVNFKNQQVIGRVLGTEVPNLPNTGAAEGAAGLLASGGLGLGIKQYFKSRKGLLGALLNK